MRAFSVPLEVYEEYMRAHNLLGLDHSKIMRAALMLWLEKQMGYHPSNDVAAFKREDAIPRANWAEVFEGRTNYVPGFRAPEEFYNTLDDIRWGKDWSEFMLMVARSYVAWVKDKDARKPVDEKEPFV